MKIQDLHSAFLTHQSVSTDTRKIKENDIFFALKGDNFNGNIYAQKALDSGASIAIIDEEKYFIDDRTILVEDVLTTLQQLANYHRKYSKAQVISLTGSNGKTTTKELINAVLCKTYKTIATKGNLNNHIGVPLTLLTIQPDTEIAIVEMGANHLKEIEFLCKIAEPDFGYITNFGKAHLEGFGGVEGVIKGKSELYEYLIKNNKSIFLNADDPIQLDKLKNYTKKYGFSSVNSKYYNIEMTEAQPFVNIQVENTNIKTNLIGSYNFHNCCAAITIAKYFNVELSEIKTALENYTPDNNRSQIINTKGLYVILDAYNANPSSMKVAIENFNSLNNLHKTMILGDMFELGESAEEEHQNIVELTKNMNFDQVFFVGENFYKTQTDAIKLRNFDELKVFIKNNTIKANSAILIKGSRGMALERVLDCL
ncbi:UDP-N-acetylmuramoyl-tripeptide--D-alanyl-D-alanine ligase [Maribacter hydrothermalis]|uniref:UDP-N-acetylmuramoyl-tripeptide--D-alanyl-D-alanine ligase n=1 Tax=Maribacter hydrothermalis TaxID=1836467 RepID=A0A1B7ZDN1_9FLAO|nr:UDP-N-acetylmuramoyl-tripeptide--D-alanyl-D-alanine ligase [Maribacter hydrothermalis]APQ16670.1 UDP-N-acetylmuramoyl-tripeptide--D-alanyl-D-alanine ligase [Maribacter hydrothermalis]OBR41426.1 UDP-N-acetylmuramoyl-tripeptide--D-alanyl-D-alanine ligase [Maribacter hydrothermalis]